MAWLAAVGLILGTLLARGRDIFEFTNDVFGSFVAVTGDAHQAKVAQDIFRQEIRYERSLQIREDIRDVNKMMLESVQTHLFMGSIILGVCFSMFIEGYPPVGSTRLLADLWVVFCCWATTFTLISLWLALCFQGKISTCARERLLRKHRFQMPDDQVVGKMGGASLINTIALFHDRVLELVNGVMLKAPEDRGSRREIKTRRARMSDLRVQVEAGDGQGLDVAPMQKGMHAWLRRKGHGLALPTILDMPAYLIGETVVRSRWFCRGNAPLQLRVAGEATLYIAAQCPPRDSKPNDGISSALKSQGLLEWPVDQLPVIIRGHHDTWRGTNGHGEFRRVNGFSVYVDTVNVELPLYKIVLQSPADEGDGMVDVEVAWRFKDGCEGLLVILRRGQIHCKEEDWPIVEFNEEIKQILPLRDFSGLYMRYGVSCLIMGAFFMCCARLNVEERSFWWFEMVLVILALIPALLAILVVPIHQSGAAITQNLIPEQKVRRSLNRGKAFMQRSVNLISKTSSDNDTPQKDETSMASMVDLGGRSNADNHSDDFGSLEHSPGDTEAEANQDVPLDGGNGLTRCPRDCVDSTATPPLISAETVPSHQNEVADSRAMSPQRLLLGLPAARQMPPVTAEREGAGAFTGAGQMMDRLGEGVLGHLDLGRRCSALEMARCNEVLRPACEPVMPALILPRSPQRQEKEDTGESPCVGHRLSAESIGPGRRDSCDTAHSSLSSQAQSEDEHIVQDLVRGGSSQALTKMMLRIPSVMRPIDPDKPLMIEGATAKSLRLTLRKFRLWTNTLRFLFVTSVLSALASPYVWIEKIQQALRGRVSETDAPPLPALALALPWMEWEVAWPPFFHPTAAALEGGAGPGQVLWLAAEGVLRGFVARDSGSRTAFRSAGPAMLLPAAAHGLAAAASGNTVPLGRRLVVAGVGGLFEVDLNGTAPWSPLPQHSASVAWPVSSSIGLPDVALVPAVGPLHSLPEGMESGTLLLSAVAVLTGLDAVAIALADTDAGTGGAGLRSTIHLCRVAGADASAAGRLRSLGRLGPLAGPVHALHACEPGACASEPVLWAAAGGTLLAVGLASGTVLGAFTPPVLPEAPVGPVLLRGSHTNAGTRSAATVVALAGNASHLLVVAAADGSRPLVFSTPYPMLPSDGVPIIEL